MTDEDYGGYPVHPACDMFPLIQGDAFDELVADIKANGLREPSVVTTDRDGRTVLIDGRNRYRACIAAGVEPQFENLPFIASESITDWIVSHNLHRRHLTPSQRAAVAVDLEKVYAEEAKARQLAALETSSKRGGEGKVRPDSDEPIGRADEQAAHAVGVGRASVAAAKRVAKADTDLFEKVRSGEVSVNAAERQVKAKDEPRSLAALIEGSDRYVTDEPEDALGEIVADEPCYLNDIRSFISAKYTKPRSARDRGLLRDILIDAAARLELEGVEGAKPLDRRGKIFQRTRNELRSYLSNLGSTVWTDDERRMIAADLRACVEAVENGI